MGALHHRRHFLVLHEVLGPATDDETRVVLAGLVQISARSSPRRLDATTACENVLEKTFNSQALAEIEEPALAGLAFLDGLHFQYLESHLDGRLLRGSDGVSMRANETRILFVV